MEDMSKCTDADNVKIKWEYKEEIIENDDFKFEQEERKYATHFYRSPFINRIVTREFRQRKKFKQKIKRREE